MQITDIHVGKRDPRWSNPEREVDNFREALGNTAEMIRPEIIVATGDLTDSTNEDTELTEDLRLYEGSLPDGPWAEEWIKYFDVAKDSRAKPWIYLDMPGNHDRYNNRYLDQDPRWWFYKDQRSECAGPCSGPGTTVDHASGCYYLDCSRGAIFSIIGQQTNPAGHLSHTVSKPFGEYLFVATNTNDETGESFRHYVFPDVVSDYPVLSPLELGAIKGQLEMFDARAAKKLSFVFGHAAIFNLPDHAELPGLEENGGVNLANLLNQYQVSLYGFGHTHDSFDIMDNSLAHGLGNTLLINESALYEEHYRLYAVDNDGLSTVALHLRQWPVVIITSPVNTMLGGMPYPGYDYPYSTGLPRNSAFNSIRAHILPASLDLVPEYQIDGGAWEKMHRVAGRETEYGHIWEGLWDTKLYTAGYHNVTVRAAGTTTIAAGLRMCFIRISRACRLGRPCNT
ncbi:MAG: metallophosphoesterase [Candidatus Geothermincolia bacterium]